jgi:hypothetical protein
MRLLPRTKASPDFTSDVMRRIRREGRVETGERRLPFVWRMSAAFASAACLALVVHGAIAVHAHRQDIAEMRVERQKLAAELEAVKKIANEAEPVLVLEDNNGTRVIMDLDSAVQPASLRTFD